MAIGGLIAAAVGSSILSGGANLAGTIYGVNKSAESVSKTNDTNLAINRMNNAFNAEQAQLQRDFEERMSNTAVQRKVADLQAAGLNPALAVSSGSASTPGAYAATSSGNAQMKAADYSPYAKLSVDLGHMVNSAARIKQLDEMIHKDPKVASTLNNVQKEISKSVNSAAKMDRVNSVYEDWSDGDLIRGVNLWK